MNSVSLFGTVILYLGQIFAIFRENMITIKIKKEEMKKRIWCQATNYDWKGYLADP